MAFREIVKVQPWKKILGFTLIYPILASFMDVCFEAFTVRKALFNVLAGVAMALVIFWKRKKE